MSNKITSLGDIFRVTKSSGLFDEMPLEQIVPAYYWLEHHHAGQWSWEYEAFCRLGNTFTPGYGGMDTEDPDGSTVMAYDDLCTYNGCTHETLASEVEQ